MHDTRIVMGAMAIAVSTNFHACQALIPGGSLWVLEYKNNEISFWIGQPA